MELVKDVPQGLPSESKPSVIFYLDAAQSEGQNSKWRS